MPVPRAPPVEPLLDVIRDVFMGMKLPSALGGGTALGLPASPLPSPHKRVSAPSGGKGEAPLQGVQAAFARLPRTAPPDSLLSR